MTLKITSKRANEHLQNLQFAIDQKNATDSFKLICTDKKLTVQFYKTNEADYNLLAEIFCKFIKNFNYNRCLTINLREIDSYLRDDQLVSVFDSDNQYWENLLQSVQARFMVDSIKLNLNLLSSDDFVAKNTNVNDVFKFLNQHFFGKEVLKLQLFEYEFIYFSQTDSSLKQIHLNFLELFFKRIYGENIKLVAVGV